MTTVLPTPFTQPTDNTKLLTDAFNTQPSVQLQPRQVYVVDRQIEVVAPGEVIGNGSLIVFPNLPGGTGPLLNVFAGTGAHFSLPSSRNGGLGITGPKPDTIGFVPDLHDLAGLGLSGGLTFDVEHLATCNTYGDGIRVDGGTGLIRSCAIRQAGRHGVAIITGGPIQVLWTLLWGCHRWCVDLESHGSTPNVIHDIVIALCQFAGNMGDIAPFADRWDVKRLTVGVAWNTDVAW